MRQSQAGSVAQVSWSSLILASCLLTLQVENLVTPGGTNLWGRLQSGNMEL